MVTMGIERLHQLVQKPTSYYASTDRDEESAMEATDSESSGETRYRTRGCKNDRKGRRQRHRSRTPSTSPKSVPTKTPQQIAAKKKQQQESRQSGYKPDQMSTLQGIWRLWPSHAAPKNVPHDKCNYNKKCKGWRPEWVGKKIGMAYKYHGDCK